MEMHPKNEAELAEMVAGLERPMRIKGGGTRAVGRVEAQGTLDMSGLSGVTLYEPGALTLVAQAGTPLAEVEALLDAENQRLSFEPMDHRVLLGTSGAPTLGGMVAANVSGPRRIAVGACRDFALGVRFVDGQGRIIKNGGRVMKNVTGYDLVKLMAGSWGTLGAITEVSLKVMPKPETEATLQVHVKGAAAAARAMSDALGSPYEVTGAAQAERGGPVSLRLEGFAPSVAYRAEKLSAELARHGEVSQLDAGASAALWTDIRDVTRFAGKPFVAKLSISPTAMPAFHAAAAAHEYDALHDWGGGLIWVAGETSDMAAFVQSYCFENGGHATLVKADADVLAERGAFQPEAAGVARLSAGVRQRFDPKALFNAGLMG